jgi:hypothetical protein
VLQGDHSSLVGVCEATSCSSFTESFEKNHTIKKHYEGKKGYNMVPVSNHVFFATSFFFPSPPLQRCVSELAEVVVINPSPPFFTSAILQLDSHLP